jgi:hypothetical protein
VCLKWDFTSIAAFDKNRSGVGGCAVVCFLFYFFVLFWRQNGSTERSSGGRGCWHLLSGARLQIRSGAFRTHLEKIPCINNEVTAEMQSIFEENASHSGAYQVVLFRCNRGGRGRSFTFNFRFSGFRICFIAFFLAKYERVKWKHK